MICFLSIASLVSPVLHRDNAMFKASYFSPLDFSEVDKFDLLISNSCISVAIANDMQQPGRRETSTFSH